jgi:hypothetical protein
MLFLKAKKWITADMRVWINTALLTFINNRTPLQLQFILCLSLLILHLRIFFGTQLIHNTVNVIFESKKVDYSRHEGWINTALLTFFNNRTGLQLQ